ncbi:nuclear ribonuclease P subunit Rpp21 (Rpr2) [Andalucia godoyi]|uniref:Nuclear ribonuclease P subunit Rpp21 (Rpr2) n=1 Tax=Andalucia godoyi TaxID=505711 RepID=A0A8K0F4A9_ANDGO|nr:nuclear ribonuclease P subunit Rpp21 (Rpr2) [Andalucia godoyi]|eukprot:ANDGO_06534.mRNA.1 nuclear ribonuclease P subunit Rpp21 (Rpr2)
MGRGSGQASDHAHRINYLYQAIHTLHCTKGSTDLCRSYASLLKKVASKSQTRLSRTIKRSFCKKCDMFLIPGATALLIVDDSVVDKPSPAEVVTDGKNSIDQTSSAEDTEMVPAIRIVCAECGASTIL